MQNIVTGHTRIPPPEMRLAIFSTPRIVCLVWAIHRGEMGGGYNQCARNSSVQRVWGSKNAVGMRMGARGRCHKSTR